ncbi:hypothetical protein CPB97_001023 [Podila verticillata]|nr:hypothetical protein CPB97_001023 [Podila verticillata]
MAATLTPHRHLRFYRFLLIGLGGILLALNTLIISKNKHQQRLSSASLNANNNLPQDPTYAAYSYAYKASLMLPNIAMVAMYCVLASGRPRCSNQTLHSTLRVFFSLMIVAGLVYYPATVITGTIDLVALLQGLNARRLRDGIQLLHEGTVAERLFCTEVVYENGWGLNWCQMMAARNVLHLVVAALVLVELVAGCWVGEIGRKGGKKKEEGGALNPAVYAFPV